MKEDGAFARPVFDAGALLNDFQTSIGSAFDARAVFKEYEAITRPTFDVSALLKDYEASIGSAFDARALIKDYEAFIRPVFDSGSLLRDKDTVNLPLFDVRPLLKDYEALARSTIDAQALLKEIDGVAEQYRDFEQRLSQYLSETERRSQAVHRVPYIQPSETTTDIVVVRAPVLIQDPVAELVAWIVEKCRSIPGFMEKAKHRFVDLCVIACMMLTRLLSKVGWEDAMGAVYNVVIEMIQIAL